MNIDFNSISTEMRNDISMGIDKLSTIDMITMINDEDKKVADAVECALPDIAAAIDVIYKQLQSGGRLIYIGAGTSGRLGILDAVECFPTYGVGIDVVTALMAGGNEAFTKAVEGAEDNHLQGRQDLINNNLSAKDVLVGITASGRTPYVMGALEYAQSIGAPAISISCSKAPILRSCSDITISVVVGPEVITGSTRMKSGTAQKMVLNIISTAVMIKLGKVYQNLMVDVRPTNEKLKHRVVSIVTTATGVSPMLAKRALEECSYSAKHAIIMLLANVSAAKAKEMLEQNENRISQALQDE